MALPAYGIANLASATFGSAPAQAAFSNLFEFSKAGVRLKAATANAITHVRFSAKLVSGTSPTYKVSLQGVTSDGFPDGTIKSSGNAKGTFTPISTTPTVFEVSLGSSYTPSVGETLCVVFDHDSGTIDFSNYSAVCHFYYSITPSSQHFAAVYDQGFGGGYASERFPPAVVLKTASERYGGLLLTNGGSSGALMYKEVTTTGHRAAAKIVIPAASYIQSLTISGFNLSVSVTAAQSLKAAIWNAAGTELASATIDTEYAYLAFNGSVLPVELDTPLSVSPGDTIYAGFQSISSSSAKIGVLDFDNTSDRDCVGSVASQGSIIYSAWNGSAWTDSGTDVPLIQVNLSGITGAAGGGGGAANLFGSLIR